MHIRLKAVAGSALVATALVVSLGILQIVNRREFGEPFPLGLFVGLWLGPFTVGLILLPIAQAWWAGVRGGSNRVTPRRTTWLANPRPVAWVSLFLLLVAAVRSALVALEWEPLQRLLNGSNPEVAYLPGVTASVVLGLTPVAAGVLAAGPIVDTLRSGGHPLAHPVLVLIVVTVSALFAVGVGFLIVDQWPCFMGVPNCD